MKKIIQSLSTAAVASQLFIAKAFALNDPPTLPGVIEGDTDIKVTVVNLLVKVLDYVTLIGVVFVVVAGIRLIVSGGDEGEKDKAKKTIIYVVIGIIVILFARVIVSFVANQLFASV